MKTSRREFLGTIAVTPLALMSTTACQAASEPAQETGVSNEKMVMLVGDGPRITPAQYIDLFSHIHGENEIRQDNYGRGGTVAELEETFARRLGKEAALFFPTGTLANHMAIVGQTRGRPRVILQEQSHVNCDAEKGLHEVSGLITEIIPSQDGTFDPEVIERLLIPKGARKTDVGVISVENPVRRAHGRVLDQKALLKLANMAGKHGIRLHLDAARMDLACVFSGTTPAEIAAPFDTVYVSLYKYLHAPGGAILAGPAKLLEQLREKRHMNGGTLYQCWMFAAVALHALDGFSQRLTQARDKSRICFTELASEGLALEPIPNGSNIFRLHLPKDSDPARFSTLLQEKGIILNRSSRSFHGFHIWINETFNFRPTDLLTAHLRDALNGSK